MPILPTPQLPSTQLSGPFRSSNSDFLELHDTLNNIWWLVEADWLLVAGPRYNTCTRVFETLAAEQNPPSLPEHASVMGMTYGRVVFKQSEETPRRVGFVETGKV